MQKLPDNCIHLAFADPPFNIGYEYDEYDDRLDSEKYLAWSRTWMAEVHRILASDGAFWLAIGDEYAAELKIEAQKLGFHCRSWVSWYYTFGVNCTMKFTRSHAHLFHFVRNKDHFTFNAAAVKVPSARQLVYNDSRAASGGRLPDDTFILRPQDCVDGLSPDEDTWYFPRVAGTFKERAGFHGCQMPEQLLGRVIDSCSNEGDIVFDPFSGSATTLAVAKKRNRRFFGFELSTEYASRGTARLGGISVGDRLDGSEEPKVSAPQTGNLKSSKSDKYMSLFGFRPAIQLPPGFPDSSGLLIDAFANTSRGFSVDRVVADPILNEDFQKECDRLAIDGSRPERNRLLFRIRKAGHLKRAGILTSTETLIPWGDLSPFIFASEIAWRKISDRFVLSLDEILCDDRIAKQFDDIAAKFAPGFTPFEYRWGAMKLRKEGMNARIRAKNFRKELHIRKLQAAVPLRELRLDSIPAGPGVYGIAISGLRPKFLYAAETSQLQDRLIRHFGSDLQRSQWLAGQPEIEVFFGTVPTIDDHRLARQSLLLKWYNPAWNIVDLLSA
ncbi:MAG: site-specific DNA-methyltransferase [Planctomycetaceae bacterium]|nr:site-specific DNA-methyltransferase [Planctomycetaceae bacterium]